MTTGDPQAPPPHHRWRRRPGAAWRATLRGVVLLAPTAEEPVTVVGSGREVWELLDRPRSLDELVSELSERHPAPVGAIRSDVADLLVRLTAIGALDELAGTDGDD